MEESMHLGDINWIPYSTPHALPLGQGHIHPSATPHAVSASLPTWASVITWSEKNKALLDSVEYSYPRFFICLPLRSLTLRIRERLKISGDEISCLVFPSARRARHCVASLESSSPDPVPELHDVRFFLPDVADSSEEANPYLTFSVVMLPTTLKKQAMGVWMDTGAGISTRHAEFCLEHIDYLASDSSTPAFKTPAPAKRPRDLAASRLFQGGPGDMRDVQTRVAQLATSARDLKPVRAEDVLVFPTGMNAIFNTCEALAALSPESAVVAYGWLYPETVNVLRKSAWERVISFKWGTEEELDKLEALLMLHPDRITALFCELPSNIKFISPNLARIRELADRYNIIVACDETAGNFINLDILPYVDVVLSSLTKMFSGASDVTGGSVVINPNSRHYGRIRNQLAIQYQDVCCFPTDVAALKRNSANMACRVRKANANAMAVVEFLQQQPCIAQVLHPSRGPTFTFYERHRRREGGYGNVLSVVFRNPDSARCFYDNLDVCKGSSFGTNFTLAIPYVQLACYWTQEKCEKYGLPRHILRISVGLEDADEICGKLALALAEVERLESVEVGRTGVETDLRTTVAV
ncbi:pyridoxal phosphate-dependent transferase [Dichotomopilus funicola]|uniref:Pyridoxal phosphate-dependent transferase n=1 Tax=Dichotomopilus funicola TaxID=1934379 RepID=A0AAN6UVP8_9PEZI|nr:pyridoxal phosphate-dependent transferase [Dichotomopilus funicola]